MIIFHSYVSLPEGNSTCLALPCPVSAIVALIMCKGPDVLVEGTEGKQTLQKKIPNLSTCVEESTPVWAWHFHLPGKVPKGRALKRCSNPQNLIWIDLEVWNVVYLDGEITHVWLPCHSSPRMPQYKEVWCPWLLINISFFVLLEPVELITFAGCMTFHFGQITLW